MPEMREDRPSLVSLAASLATIAALIILAKVMDLAPAKDGILAWLLFVGMLSAVVSLWDVWLDRKHSFEMERLISELESATPRRERPSWLMTEEEVVRMELGWQGREILVVTPDFSKNPVFEDVVRANIARGVQYAFLYPRTSTNELLASGIRNFAELSDRPLPKRFPIASAEFQLLTATEIAIYNPLMRPDGDSISAVLELPGIPFWIRLEEKAAMDLSARFHRFVDWR